MCERNTLTRSLAELVPLCEPSMGLQLGTLLEDTAGDVQHEVHGVEGKTKRRARRWKVCPVRQEAAKAVEERTTVTASEQQHATDAEAKVNEQETLADWQVQAAVA